MRIASILISLAIATNIGCDYIDDCELDEILCQGRKAYECQDVSAWGDAWREVAECP